MKMEKQAYLGRHLVGIGIAVFFLKGIYLLPDELMSYLLRPYATLCSWFYNIDFTYEAYRGYICMQRNFVISKACLGNGYMCMLFIFLYWYKPIPIRKSLHRVGAILGLTIISGYLINSVRIVASVPYTEARFFGLIHGMIGSVLYLGSLIVISAVLRFVEKRGMEDGEVGKEIRTR